MQTRPHRSRARPHTRAAARVTALAALAALLAGAVLLATPAWAHDELLSTDPATGQSVAGVPAEVVLTFAEPPLALGMAVQVIGPDGTDVAAGPPTLSGSVVHQAIEAAAPAGRYTVHWRVTADDGHPVTGGFSFTAQAGGGGATPAGSSGGTPAAATGSSSTSPLLWWVAAAVLVLLGLLAATAARRRTRSGPRDVREGALGD